MLFICYPKCSTCQKAGKWLDEHGLDGAADDGLSVALQEAADGGDCG